MGPREALYVSPPSSIMDTSDDGTEQLSSAQLSSAQLSMLLIGALQDSEAGDRSRLAVA